jgi:probable H4MPT-linked C1 transfer pathway protein
VIFGWDLGGAHAKLAVLHDVGGLARVAQAPCPLWLGLEHLEHALRALAGDDRTRGRHALTMTGELVDLFPDRASGVAAIVERFREVIGDADALVFAGERFVDCGTAKVRWAEVASANWRAAAVLAAALVPEALVVDVGSTTTDVTLVADGRIQAQGRDDHGRLALEELVYTGVVRTPLATVASVVPFGGAWVSPMAEHFATTGDVYRITGELDPRFDHAATADGRDRSREASLRRLARLIGIDFDPAQAAAWERLAGWLAHAQTERIRRACDRSLSRGLIGRDAPVVGLGVGEFVAARLAAALDRPYREFATLVGAPDADRPAVNTCGPAFAVAELRRQTR